MSDPTPQMIDLFIEYLNTLSADSEEEAYASSRYFANDTFRGFIEWLDKRNNTNLLDVYEQKTDGIRMSPIERY